MEIQHMRVNLTAPMVESLKGPKNGKPREIFWDKKLPGFGLRVSDSGHRSWLVAYRRGGRKGRLEWYKVGTYPPLSLAEARDKAKDALAAVQKGDNPAEEKREARDADTFAVLAARYLAEHARRWKKSAAEDERNIRHDLLPAWGNRRVHEITRRDVTSLLENIVSRGAPIMANRVLALVSKIFAFGFDKGITETNPAYRVKRPAPERRRDRVLSQEEITKVWPAFDAESLTPRAILKLLILTGQRSGEVAGMRWAEVNLSSGWWEIPGERTKNGLVQRVPLVGEVFRILRELEGDRQTDVPDYVFPGRTGKAPYTALQRVQERVIKKSGVNFRPHDLRRTFSTHLHEIGVPGEHVEKLLNHVNGGVAGIYNRYKYDREKCAALEHWDRRLRQILTGEPAETPKLPT
jgi:integrase